jgi:DNA (cytosine-5)-methyltransferase 1
VAGKREGFKGESGLFFYTTDIIRRMRDATGGKYPRFLCWENVPGALNSSGGADFRALLEAVAETEIPIPEGGKWANSGLVQCDRCEIAWSVLDSQYFGLAQRRARIFLVADFAESERRAGKILFVEPSGGGDSSQSQGEGKEVAGSLADSVGDASQPANIDAVVLRDWAGKPGGGKGPLLSVEKSLTLQANTNDQVLFESHPNDSRVTGPVDVAPSVTARYGTGGNNTPLILNDQGGSVMNVEKDKVGTLRAEAHGNNPIVLEQTQNAIGVDVYNGAITGEIACTVTAASGNVNTSGPKVITFEPGVATRDGGHIYTDDKCCTLRANPGDNFPTVVEPIKEDYCAFQNTGHGYWKQSDTAATLRLPNGDHGNLVIQNDDSIVSSAGFKPEQGKDARGLGYEEEKAPTLTGNTPAVVYGICSKDSNSMKSSNPNSGIYEADKARTLDTSGANPNCNQGGNVVVESLPFTEKADCLYAAYGTKWNGNGAAYNGSLFAQTVPNKKIYALEGNGARPSHRGDGWSETETMYTLNTIERHAVAQPINKVITYDIKKTVLVRKHPVDVEGLKALLRHSLKESGLTRKELAEQLNVPQTQVDHYFRTDNCFAIPEKEIWYPLKKLLGITTMYFDAQVTEFVEEECNFDSSNRIYDSRGIAPAITSTNADKMILQPTDGKKMTYATSKASFMTNWTEDKAQTLVATDWKDAPVIVQENKDEEDV